jgi:hypothetical protein
MRSDDHRRTLNRGGETSLRGCDRHSSHTNLLDAGRFRERPQGDGPPRPYGLGGGGGRDHQPHLFLDPDTGFYDRHGAGSAKTVLVAELIEMLAPRRTLIVYRHQYWPKLQQNGESITAQPYVRHGLLMLRGAGMSAFAYQSQSASVFFAARQHEDLVPFETGLRNAFAGVSKEIVERRLVT